MGRKFSLLVALQSGNQEQNWQNKTKKKKAKRPFEPYTKATATLVRKNQIEKNKELEDAVAYCKENNVQ